MKYNKSMILILLVSVVFGSGCNKEFQRKIDKWFGNMPEPENVITINQIVEYPRAKKIEKQIGTFSGKMIWINIHAFVHSNVIRKIELRPRSSKNKYFDLKLYMNRRGRQRWLQLSANFKGEPLAFVIDGIFYRSFIPKPMVGEYDNDNNTTYVVIEGPFDKGTAEALKKSAPDSFTYYNDNDEKEF